ncbi:hypothetical protein CA13_59320 [Planctomycetes bacterium CA13]|uniref:Uncharacterized protein n=1 Tax=Novipirellula herctigrandis TaxID=2527986 RepID=A0A5C5ZAW4_9BACT|nr:hypothetical protein CA13_59320 [Planctomycetes bacterium CA13]
MPVKQLSRLSFGFAALLLSVCLTGCSGSTEAEVDLDPNDPRLIESDEVINFVPETFTDEEIMGVK